MPDVEVKRAATENYLCSAAEMGVKVTQIRVRIERGVHFAHAQ